MLLKPLVVIIGRTAGSHAGSHADVQPSEDPDLHEQPEETSPRSQTDLNGTGYAHMELWIWRLRIGFIIRAFSK